MKVLQFSGGVDSLATLYLKRPEWDNITVLWCNTGAAYPETTELVHRIQHIVPHFHEVKSNKHEWEEVNGTAVDIVPERTTLLGSLIHGEPPVLFTSFLRCCAANIWEPMERASIELGATHIIRGQRKYELRKAPISNGFVDQRGIVYEFPVEDWTKGQIFDYCAQTCPDLVPESYKLGEKTSRDCLDCIAYLDENEQRIRNLPKNLRGMVMLRLERYNAALQPDYQILQGLLK